MPKKHVPKKKPPCFSGTLISGFKKTSRLGKVPVVLDDGCNPRPVRRQFFAQPVVPQESDSTVGGGGYDGYDPFVTPKKVKVNVFSIVFNLTPPPPQCSNARSSPGSDKNIFSVHRHGFFRGDVGMVFRWSVCWRTFCFFFKKKFLMELPAAERSSQDESCHCKSFHRKKTDVILEIFAKKCIFFSTLNFCWKSLMFFDDVSYLDM